MSITPQISAVLRMLIRADSPVHYDHLGITLDRMQAIRTLVKYDYARWTHGMTYLEWTGKTA